MLLIWRNIGVIHVSLHGWKVIQQSLRFFFPSLKTKAHASWECGKRGHKSGIVGGGCWTCPLWCATRWCVEWKMIRRSKRGTLGVEGFFSMKWWEYRYHVLGDAVQRFKWSILKSLLQRIWKRFTMVYHPNCHFQRENEMIKWYWSGEFRSNLLSDCWQTLGFSSSTKFFHGFPRQTWKENISALKLATKGLWLDIFRGIQHCGMIDMIVVSSSIESLQLWWSVVNKPLTAPPAGCQKYVSWNHKFHQIPRDRHAEGQVAVNLRLADSNRGSTLPNG